MFGKETKSYTKKNKEVENLGKKKISKEFKNNRVKNRYKILCNIIDSIYPYGKPKHPKKPKKSKKAPKKEQKDNVKRQDIQYPKDVTSTEFTTQMIKKLRREKNTGKLFVKGTQNDRDDIFIFEMLDEFGGYKTSLEKEKGARVKNTQGKTKNL